jgi:hypothetical protein
MHEGLSVSDLNVASNAVVPLPSTHVGLPRGGESSLFEDGATEVRVVRHAPFIWPAEGPVTSEMGPWHTLGIDIGLEADVDSPIQASSGGRVTFAGGEVTEEFGYHVIIDHGNDIETLYGHMSELFVSEGESVRQGQVLGLGGSTGVSDGKHLHFEVRSGKARVDPEHVLPSEGINEPQTFIADCSRDALVVESGGTLELDYPDASGQPVSIRGLRIEASVGNGVSSPRAAIESGTHVLFKTSPTFTGADEPDEYQLVVEFATLLDSNELACTVLVMTRTVEPSFYVRPTNTPTPLLPTQTPVPPTPTFTPTPTPTPTPTKTPFPRRT